MFKKKVIYKPIDKSSSGDLYVFFGNATLAIQCKNVDAFTLAPLVKEIEKIHGIEEEEEEEEKEEEEKEKKKKKKKKKKIHLHLHHLYHLYLRELQWL